MAGVTTVEEREEIDWVESMMLRASEYDARVAINGTNEYSSDPCDWQLSDFELLRTISMGAFFRVRLCRLRGSSPAQYFAIKCLDKAQVIKKKQVEHLGQEVDLLLQVADGPFLVKLFCSFQDERQIYLVQEFVIGGEIFTHLKSANRFPNDVAKFYLAQVVLAVEYLHMKSIIHRDIKPESLLLDSKGNIKLTDFSYAKKLAAGSRTYTLVGTPEYLAPEIIQAKGHTAAVDYWCLGILLFEFVAGYPPFYDDSPFKVYEKILDGKVKFPDWVDPRARDLVKGFLTVDKDKRLGNLKGGVADVKGHPYFHGASWEKLRSRHYPAPIPVKVKSPGDAINFESYAEDNTDYSTVKPLTDQQQQQFANF